MLRTSPPVSYGGATVVHMTKRLLTSAVCLCLMFGAFALIVWGMSADYQCTGSGQDMSCAWSHSLIPGAHAPHTSTQDLENR